jgi:hypothetical protein
MKTQQDETRPEAGEPPPVLDLGPSEGSARRRWRPGLLAADGGRARREERVQRRLRKRQRRYQKSVARRRQRELASLERRLLGRSRTGITSRAMPFSRPARDDTASLEAFVAQAVERALDDERERSRAEAEKAVDMRVRLLAKRLARRVDQEVERRVAAELSGKRTKSPARAQRPGAPERRP